MLSEEKRTLIDTHAHNVLKRFYGYDNFRPRQLEIIETVCSGRDSLVLMPTGGGKSLCYQIPALILPGLTVVVSPLIALMNDQVQALLSNGIPAAALHSNQSEAQNAEILDRLRHGQLKLLYISPERLLIEIERWPENMQLSLFAIDEAHCISQWGHDFRPEYAKLARIKELFPRVPVVALTATADKLTRNDIAERLNLNTPQIFISSFDRPNISLTVRLNPGKVNKLKQIRDIIDRYAEDSGIIYCLSRKQTEEMAAELAVNGYRVAIYHAGLSAAQRNDAQQQFIRGDVQVVCATIAFGMGIDKSNIRYVIHNNLPKNIESYYQEIGRAGRDGLPAEAVMYWSFADVATLRSFIERDDRMRLNLDKLERIHEYAESSVCRRRVLLSYFSEPTVEDCGNCDVCLNPPTRFDGTVITQKALSAIVRTEQKVGISMLVDILRGSTKADLVRRGYHLIKTYGVGRDMGAAEWTAYISQMIQLGLIEIAYDENNHLRLTTQGQLALRGRTPVTLAKFNFPQKSQQKKTQPPKKIQPNKELISRLKRLRSDIAKIEGMPPYIICSDKTILDIAAKLPVTKDEFANIHGIGEVKTERLWTHFTRVVRQWKKEHPSVF